MRIYIPVTPAELSAVASGNPLNPGQAYAVTDTLLSDYSLTSTEEEMAEFVAMSLAAQKSRLLQRSEYIRRIVIAADAANVREVEGTDAETGLIEFLDQINIADIASVHADATSILATSVTNHNLDDASDLSWWAVQEMDTFAERVNEKGEQHG